VAIERLSGSVREICWSGEASTCFSSTASLPISSFSFVSFSVSLVTFVASGLARLLSVGRVKLAQIARDAFLQLSTPPFHLCAREVLVPVVHGLELAAVDGGARRRQQPHLSAQFDETRTRELKNSR
jgi:hypothetical protein